MKHLMIGVCMAALGATTALAQDMVTYTTDQSFADVTFGLENAIVGEGLVIDATSYVGDMLERTKADVGSDVTIFLNANVYSFCSAALSRKVMEINPMNLIYCPYGIFVAQSPDTPDQTMIGYRSFPEGEMKEVEALLDSIARTAIGQ